MYFYSIGKHNRQTFISYAWNIFSVQNMFSLLLKLIFRNKRVPCD